MIVGGRIPDHAQRKPDAPAIVCDDQVVTWGAFEAAIRDAVNALEAHAPGGRMVALLLGNTPQFLACFLACARSGRTGAVVDPTWPQAMIADVLARLAPDLICDPTFAAGAAALRACAAPPVSPTPETPFYVGFTSGSTGRPKGYRRNHRSWVASFEGDAREFGLGENDIVLAPGSMSHSLFLYAAVHALHIGATVIISRTFRPDRALQLGSAWRATAAYGAPTQWKMLTEQGGPALPDVRWAFSSGAKWFASAGAALAQLAPNAGFVEFYGASELSFIAVRKPGEGCPEAAVGRAFDGVALAIRRPDGSLCAACEPGRIFVKSEYLFSGYVLGGPAPEAIDGAMTVGDVGFIDDGGFLHLVGRQNRMIVTSGKNVYPEEIEAVLQGFPGVRAASVLGAPDARRGERIVAVILLEDGARASRRDLSAHLRARLPLAFVPRIIVRMTEWRWTASGKTDHGAVRALWESGATERLE
jgi:long-chain acyl-CoA synthetase